VEYLDEDSLFEKMFLFDKSKIKAYVSFFIAIHAYIIYLNALDGKTLSTINEDAKQAFKDYKELFCAMCNELYEIGLQEHKKRLEEIRLFKKAVNGGKETTQNEARK
jgi:ferritin-like protein